VRKLTELLRATIDPAQQKEAEDQLTQVRKKKKKEKKIAIRRKRVPFRAAGGEQSRTLLRTCGFTPCILMPDVSSTWLR